jgi:hypothetical protein
MKIPEPVTVATVFATGEKVQIPGYTVEQMLAWGKANAEAEREACAKVCEAKRIVKGGEVFAAAIRARGNT